MRVSAEVDHLALGRQRAAKSFRTEIVYRRVAARDRVLKREIIDLGAPRRAVRRERELQPVAGHAAVHGERLNRRLAVRLLSTCLVILHIAIRMNQSSWNRI